MIYTRYCNTNNIKNENKYDKNDINHKINKAKDFIKDNCLNNITINEISEHVKLSKFYFIKLFKEILHISPHGYLLNCKIDIAKKLLSQGLNSIDVSNEVGFFDQSHFSKVFKKYVAVTPNEYKNNIVN